MHNKFIEFLHFLHFKVLNKQKTCHVKASLIKKYVFQALLQRNRWALRNQLSTKDLMQGKLIAVAYTLRTYWNQFSLVGICKQE